MTTQTFAAFMKVIGDLNQGVEETFNPERNRVSSQELFPFGKIARASASAYASSQGHDRNQKDAVEQGEEERRGVPKQRDDDPGYYYYYDDDDDDRGGGRGGEGDEIDSDDDDMDADHIRFAQTGNTELHQFRRKREPRDIADALLPNRRHSPPPPHLEFLDRRQRVGRGSSSSSSGKQSNAFSYTENAQSPVRKEEKQALRALDNAFTESRKPPDASVRIGTFSGILSRSDNKDSENAQPSSAVEEPALSKDGGASSAIRNEDIRQQEKTSLLGSMDISSKPSLFDITTRRESASSSGTAAASNNSNTLSALQDIDDRFHPKEKNSGSSNDPRIKQMDLTAEEKDKMARLDQELQSSSSASKYAKKEVTKMYIASSHMRRYLRKGQRFFLQCICCCFPTATNDKQSE